MTKKKQPPLYSEIAEETANEADEVQPNALIFGDEPPKAEEAEPKTAENDFAVECRSFIYIGPTIPNSPLNNSAVFSGSREKVEKFLSAYIGKHPTVKRLIIPTHELAKRQGSTADEHLAKQLAAEIAAKK